MPTHKQNVNPNINIFSHSYLCDTNSSDISTVRRRAMPRPDHTGNDAGEALYSDAPVDGVCWGWRRPGDSGGGVVVAYRLYDGR